MKCTTEQIHPLISLQSVRNQLVILCYITLPSVTKSSHPYFPVEVANPRSRKKRRVVRSEWKHSARLRQRQNENAGKLDPCNIWILFSKAMPVIMPIQKHRSMQMRINRVLRRGGSLPRQKPAAFHVVCAGKWVPNALWSQKIPRRVYAPPILLAKRAFAVIPFRVAPLFPFVSDARLLRGRIYRPRGQWEGN